MWWSTFDAPRKEHRRRCRVFGLAVTDADGDLGRWRWLIAFDQWPGGRPGVNAAANATARINGLFDVTSATNTFENAVAGVDLQGLQVTTAPGHHGGQGCICGEEKR